MPRLQGSSAAGAPERRIYSGGSRRWIAPPGQKWLRAVALPQRVGGQNLSRLQTGDLAHERGHMPRAIPRFCPHGRREDRAPWARRARFCEARRYWRGAPLPTPGCGSVLRVRSLRLSASAGPRRGHRPARARVSGRARREARPSSCHRMLPPARLSPPPAGA